MTEYRLAQAEAKFADLIWQNEPIRSKDLVQMAARELNWKSTTSYTVLRRLCDRGIFKNQNTVVSSLVTREQFYSRKSRQFVEETFGGSLPRFFSAFIGSGKLTSGQAEEIRQMIDKYKEEDNE